MVVLILADSLGAKEPITEGEESALMKDLDPFLIKALYGTDKAGQTGRFGAEGGMSDLLTESAFKAVSYTHLTLPTIYSV